MPKPKFNPYPSTKSQTGHNWQDDPITEGQVRRLLYLLSKNGLLEVIWRGGGVEYDVAEACEWVRANIGVAVKKLEELTKGQVQSCFEELG